MIKSASRSFVIAAICLLSFSFTFSQPLYKYNLDKVATDVYLLRPDINEYRWVTSNIIVIVNESDVLVVDSGLLPAAGERAIEEIRKITYKPVKYLVNTHWHGDHWQGNLAFQKAFPGIEIIATEQGLKGMEINGTVWAKQLYLKYFQNVYLTKYENSLTEKSMDGKVLTEAELAILKTGVAELKQDIEGVKTLKVIYPTTTYSDKLVLRRGSREIQLLYLGIGNTSGDAVVYLPREKILITGDLVVYPSPYESGMFSPEWLETSLKLAAIDYQILIPGHGEAQKDHRYLNFLNALYAEIIKEVTAAYMNGTTQVDDFKKVVTHQTVSDELNKMVDHQVFVKNLDPGFVASAIQTSFRRIMQGKK